jgi:periplasmic copper chaperone A
MTGPTKKPWLLLLLCLFAGSASAAECLPRVHDGWIRMLPGGMPMMSGFGRIENACAKPVVIVSASSRAFADASLHATTLEGGVSRMRPIATLRLGAHKSAVLAPGGLHLMLMQPATQVSPGDRIAITFKLEDGRTLVGHFTARKPGE